MKNQSAEKNPFKLIEASESKAKAFGFYWENIDQLIEQIQSECLEIQEAWQKQDRGHLQEEVGDLLLAAISLAVFCKIDAEETLHKSLEKFQKRYARLVSLAEQDGHANLKGKSMEVLTNYWNQAKNLN